MNIKIPMSNAVSTKIFELFIFCITLYRNGLVFSYSDGSEVLDYGLLHTNIYFNKFIVLSVRNTFLIYVNF